ncbi:MAG TPA: hypothetical protein VFF37_05045 [Streptomyces sp.]|nr:hypothetical protein [Planctomycetota bacterium]HZX37689.1 hypothetical protein [Streptomyces sp.]
MSNPQPLGRLGLSENTPAEKVAASRFVLRHARSREDLHELLDALGLNTTTSKGDSQ